jgi:hypothetical protein
MIQMSDVRITCLVPVNRQYAEAASTGHATGSAFLLQDR